MKSPNADDDLLMSADQAAFKGRKVSKNKHPTYIQPPCEGSDLKSEGANVYYIWD